MAHGFFNGFGSVTIDRHKYCCMTHSFYLFLFALSNASRLASIETCPAYRSSTFNECPVKARTIDVLAPASSKVVTRAWRSPWKHRPLGSPAFLAKKVNRQETQ